MIKRLTCQTVERARIRLQKQQGPSVQSKYRETYLLRQGDVTRSIPEDVQARMVLQTMQCSWKCIGIRQYMPETARHIY